MLDKKRANLGYSSGPVDEPSHKANIALLEYWETARTPGGALARADFEPLEITRLLPGIFIAEPDGDDFRIRLAGTDVEERLGRVLTGRNLTAIFGEVQGPRTADIYRYVALGNAPFTMQGHYIGDNLEHIRFEVLYLPLQFKNGTRGVLGAQFAFD